MRDTTPIWLYDGVCVLCSRAVAYTLAHEKAPLIRFIAIQSHEGRSLAKRYGVDPDNPESFLFIEHGQALPKSDGVLALAHHLNGPVRLLLFARYLPEPVRNWCYDRIARNRYRLFGKRRTCTPPDAETRHRFVLPESEQ
ncbi:MAG: DCC1-like thiol-disulfide oxidoreductase family protein [Phycisphaerales bacterium]|nr:DCC1-like thiol-disulfide oxidoreductase family protein [Phycisphaerales bacterium]